jgi:MoaA/NifB/PqqE/SkfB family radical SAM enzyme
MCPRTALADRWPALDLSWEAFQRIAGVFGRTRHVHLQGWGEPLLHPRLFDMIRVAKAAGCRVGLTTNGMLLDRLAATQLLDVGLDLLAVSIAGATRETHDTIRAGSGLPWILKNVRRFVSLRAERRCKGPKVELSYLMTRTNLAELPAAVELAASLGMDELYAINLDYVVTSEHEALGVFTCPQLRLPFGRSVAAARQKARELRLAFRAYPLDPQEVPVCEANPLKSLFISSDGWVSPCNYMGLAGRKDIPRRFHGQPVRVSRLRFGNIQTEDLLDIWNLPAYRAFRQQFADRRLAAAVRAVGLFSGSKGSGLLRSGKPNGHLPPAPEACRTCYKLYGL